MTRWSEFVQTKRGMGAAQQHLASTYALTQTETGAQLAVAIQRILDAPRDPKTIHTDTDAVDIATALSGILLAIGSEQAAVQTRRLLDLPRDELAVPATSAVEISE